MELLNIIAAGAVLTTLGYIDRMDVQEPFGQYASLKPIVDQVDDEALDVLARLDELEPEVPYTHLVHLLADRDKALFQPAQNLLGLSLAAYFYPAFGDLLQAVFHCGATVELACRLSGSGDAGYSAMRRLFDQAVMLLSGADEGRPFFQLPFLADDRILGFLSGDSRVDGALADSTTLFRFSDPLTPVIIDEALCDSIRSALLHPDLVLLLKGERGRGKSFLLRHALRARCMDALLVDVPQLLRNRKELPQQVRLLLREGLLSRCGVCLRGITAQALRDAQLSPGGLVRLIAEPLLNQGLPLFICTDRETELIPHLSTPVNQIIFPPLTRPDRIRLWEGFSAMEGLELDCLSLGSKYRFNPAEIRMAVMQLKARQKARDSDKRQVTELLNSIMPPILTKGRLEPFHPGCTMDNLVLPEPIRNKIREICASIQYSHQVYDEWNMESKFAYGKAVSVLMSGPPGTGKTMTARVLADLLQLPLYHVNLSQLVDKYIGETEKHLEEIFANAERSNLILFFDEADAVFGRRSEVSSSKDKYANTEVSYILQRLESYDGIVILASNNKGNIDPAFMRRMKYILKFQLPDETERLALWRGCFPEECPTRNIDFDFLAQNFELSGSSIKDAVLAAAFLAAQENTVISMRHLISGVKNEYMKMDKPIYASDFGIYAGMG